MGTKLSIGNDHGGRDLAMSLIRDLEETGGVDILYYGAFSRDESVDYPDYAMRVADDVASSKSKFGILVCRSGVGMCIAANKMRGVRAANCWSVEIARLSRAHNDANILCLGADFVDAKDAKEMVQVFLSTEFEVRHSPRIKKIGKVENRR
ncbi:MAG: RpiB/LacA/LacB family sugar-phosphate isomerase [Puniceicoccales bacterium]|jgi:RpiB/LacA/LacB family sugar-phosphate isomerase|nr:RpiB/LacA/LacB family sugar-phosphate isomerase [Puniceicoccales bacterium]